MVFALMLIACRSFGAPTPPTCDESTTTSPSDPNATIALNGVTGVTNFYCLGDSFSASVSYTNTDGKEVVTTTHTDCSIDTDTNSCSISILTTNSTWSASVGGWSTNGTGISTPSLKPMDCGAGSVAFHVVWTNACDNSTGSGDISTNFFVVRLNSLSVSGATHVGTNNDWVAVKKANDFVTLTANLNTSDANAIRLLSWSGGQAVAGNPFQRQVPTDASAKTVVTASCCNTSYTATVWIIWGSVSYNFSGALDSDDNLSFSDWDTEDMPDPKSAGAVVGSYTRLDSGVLRSILGAQHKVEIIGTITPSGVGNLLANDFTFTMNPQKMENYIWDNGSGHQLASVTSSTTGTHHSPGNDTALPEQTMPINDKIFALDAPGVFEYCPPSVTGYEANADNFTNYIWMSGTIISDAGTWNSHVKATFSGSTITASPCSASSGNPTLPTTWGSSDW